MKSFDNRDYIDLESRSTKHAMPNIPCEQVKEEEKNKYVTLPATLFKRGLKDAAYMQVNRGVYFLEFTSVKRKHAIHEKKLIFNKVFEKITTDLCTVLCKINTL